MNSKCKFVSVIIPTYERAALLSRAIDSVLGQTYRNFECIVVDDSSSDNTTEVVESFDDARIRYFRHHTNRHASAARNTGIAQARGDLIAFLDDDDEWLPKKLEKQVPLLVDASPEVGMVYCWMDYFDANGKLIKEHHPTFRGDVFRHVLDRQRIGGCPTLLLRRSVVEDVGGFDESLPRGNDGDFIRRVTRDYHVDYVPEVLVHVHVGHGASITSSSEQGLRNRLTGGETKLEKFPSALKQYPQIHAKILCELAVTHQRLGEHRQAWSRFRQAVQVAPQPFMLSRCSARFLWWGLKSLLHFS